MMQFGRLVVVVLLNASLISSCASSGQAGSTGVPVFTSVPQVPSGVGNDSEARRAWDIYRYLAARQIAADQLPPSGMINVDGVIVVERSDSFIVKFAGAENGRPVSYFNVSIPRDEASEIIVAKIDPAEPLAAKELEQYLAQTYWLNDMQGLEICPKYYQQIAVPATDKGWASYLIPTSIPGQQLQTGGVFRIYHPVAADSQSMPVRLTAGCGGWDVPTDAVAFVMATPVKRLPNEIDILMSIYFDVPIFMTNPDGEKTWAIEKTGYHDVTEALRE